MPFDILGDHRDACAGKRDPSTALPSFLRAGGVAAVVGGTKGESERQRRRPEASGTKAKAEAKSTAAGLKTRATEGESERQRRRPEASGTREKAEAKLTAASANWVCATGARAIPE